MKGAVALAVGLATAVSANAVPANIEARATSSASASASGTGSSTLPTVSISGNAFYVGSDRFYIRGVDYQPGGSSANSDPLADPSTCQRDIPYFKKLGLNTIRVYQVDNSANHDECMASLAEAGIYLALDVNTNTYSLNRANTAESYNPTYLQSVFATVDAFANYTNTLLFFSGNEVLNAPNTTTAAPFVKAVTRDIKQYIGERGYRNIPVGYSAADVSQNQYLMAQYMGCGSTESQGDFYAINNYEWCDPSSFSQSGWSALVSMYSNYSVPLFMSEYGCLPPAGTRSFEETNGLYQSDMTGVFSGGLVYEYSQEGNKFGLVSISGNTVTPVGQQFSDLQSELAKTSNPSGNGGAKTGGSAQPCPAQQQYWDTTPFSGDNLPATPSGAQQYFKNGAGKGPGFKGGSQDASGGSSATAASNAGQVTATYASGSGAAASASSSSSAMSMQASRTDMLSLMACSLAVLISFGFGAAVL